MSQYPRVVLGVADSICSGAAVAIDGQIRAAVNEERLCREKFAMGWPRQSIEEVLAIAGVSPDEVDLVAIATKDLYWRPYALSPKTPFASRKGFMLAAGSLGSMWFSELPVAHGAYYKCKRLLSRNRIQSAKRVLRSEHLIPAPVQFIDHHLAHAASAYYSGGCLEATVITLDGAGDGVSATVSRGSNGRLVRLHTVSSYDSIGNFYSYVTHLLGFTAHRHEGKVTGLAAYGQPRFAALLRKLIQYDNGTIRNRARAFHSAAIAKLQRTFPADASPEDIAASIQLVLEDVCTAFVSHWVDRVGMSHVSLAGGVVANVKLNQRILALSNVDSLWVHPGMGDDGLAVGAALSLSAESVPVEHMFNPLPDVYLGPCFSDSECHLALKTAGLAFHRAENVEFEVAHLLSQDKVVARFSDRMEYGPRALGNRSILVQAGDPDVNDWLNQRLGRTEFMPFAPVTLAEDADDCYRNLEGGVQAARFMTITTDCTPYLKQQCPAVVHIDGTARPQLVGDNDNPKLREILLDFKRRTGIGTIINTSFNMHEEPIVCTPDDAVRAFQSSHLDALAIGPFLTLRSDTDVPHQQSARRRSAAT